MPDDMAPRNACLSHALWKVIKKNWDRFVLSTSRELLGSSAVAYAILGRLGGRNAGVLMMLAIVYFFCPSVKLDKLIL